ncbi:MAG: general secretion pathway protein GspM [Thiothrix sp.]|nr:general secretion pathway protein GspM [Thiothrix sp.]HPQ95559.1 type II secretion system protein GspM [Thiolinea sp.]
MIDTLFTRRNQPLFAWLLLLLALLVGIFFIILPALAASTELGERIESGYARLIKMRQVAHATPRLMAEFERVQKQGLDKLFYPEGMTAAQVGKELQKQLATVVAQYRGVLTSSEVLDGSQDEEDSGLTSGYSRVTVQASFEGNMQLLRAILHQAYQAKPMIFVDRLEVKPERNAVDQRIKGSVRITTYWRGGAQDESIN